MEEGIEVVLVGGPLDGYHPRVETVSEHVHLRFNGEPRGIIRHVYILDGVAVPGSLPVFIFGGTEERRPQGYNLADSYDVPPEAYSNGA